MPLTTEQLKFFLASPDAIPQSAFEITPSDANDLSVIATGLHIGTSTTNTQDVSVETYLGTTVTFKNVIQGQRLETGAIKKVLSTGTTATNLVGYYYVTIQPTA